MGRILVLHRDFLPWLEEGLRLVRPVDLTLHTPLFLARKAGFRRFLCVFHDLSPLRNAILPHLMAKTSDMKPFEGVFFGVLDEKKGLDPSRVGN